MLSFREANANDMEAVVALFRASIAAISNEFYSEAEKTEWSKTSVNKKRWIEAIEKQYFLLAFRKDKLIGFISLENKTYIDFIYVHPKFLKQGIAQALYLKIEQKAMALKSKKLSSHVSKAALGFFQKNGFVVIQENKNVRNDEILINYTVHKKL